MLRITTGTAKNRNLKVPNISKFRGVQEIAKNSIFSILGDSVVDAVILDLYAGSGNLGLEALSRGASYCDFVDESREAHRAISSNIEEMGFTEQAGVHLKDAVKFAANTEKKYDLIFLDPFYDTHHHVFLMQNIEEILKPGGTVVFFHGGELKVEKILKNTSLKIEDSRKFGKSLFTIISSSLQKH